MTTSTTSPMIIIRGLTLSINFEISYEFFTNMLKTKSKVIHRNSQKLCQPKISRQFHGNIYK